jgi:succinyl-CoA synthetase beta subunit
MKIHEYQAKGLFRQVNIPCPDGHVVTSAAEVEALSGQLAPGVWVVKSQIHAGGRGKGRIYKGQQEIGRGVQVVESPEAALTAAREMLGGTLVTIQTGAVGKTVNRVLIEAGVDIAAEYYLAAIIDRETSTIAIMASTEGGTEIEEVARHTPEKIHTVRIDPLLGYRSYHGRGLGLKLGFSGDELTQFIALVGNLYQLFVARDCSLAEINPLVLTGQGRLVAIDGKLNFDDNGLYRQADLVELRDLSEEEPSEVEAAEAKLTYIKLDGNIGCLVNGAGLAMATMDVIKAFGGEPANFLDVGGTATPENVAKSFAIMLQDQVEGIFVNVFGGIVRCDVVAQGLVAALSQVTLEIPLVVRLAGNRMAEAVTILKESGLPIITADNMKDGAMKIVAACQPRSQARS